MTTSEDKKHIAIKGFEGNLNCAQSVLSAYCKELNLNREAAELIGAAFGAGMGEGETCGAVSGALMVLGLKYGKPNPLPEEKELLKAKFEQFKRKFELINGSLKCKELLKHDLRNPDEYEKARTNGLFNTSCTNFIAIAIDLIEEAAIEMKA